MIYTLDGQSHLHWLQLENIVRKSVTLTQLYTESTPSPYGLGATISGRRLPLKRRIKHLVDLQFSACYETRLGRAKSLCMQHDRPRS